MAGRSDLTKRGAKLVIPAVKSVVPRDARGKIGLDTRISSLGLSAADLKRLYAKIRALHPSPLRPEAFSRAKTVRDIVAILTKSLEEQIAIGNSVPRAGSVRFRSGTIERKKTAARKPAGKGEEDRLRAFLRSRERAKPEKAKSSRSGPTFPGGTKKAIKRAGTGRSTGTGSEARKKAAKAKPSRGGWSRPAHKPPPPPAPPPAPPGFEGGSGSIPVDEPAPRTTKSRKRAKPPFRDFPGPSFEAVDAGPIEAVPTAAAPEIAPPLPETERQINIWIGEGQQSFKRELRIGQTYTLNFKVGSPVEESFTSGPEAAVPAADIPEGGLPCQWHVIAHDAELAKGTPDTEVTAVTSGDVTSWSGRFDLLIPETGDSAVPQLKVKPLKADPRIDVIITARGEVYRQFKILLTASDNPGVTRVDPARVGGEQIFAAAMELGLRTTHEWTTPHGILELQVTQGPKVWAKGYIDGNDIEVPDQPWAAQSDVDLPNRGVRKALEKLRIAGQDHFDDIDPIDFADRLSRWNKKPARWGVPDPDWSKLSFLADKAHEQRWEKMASSDELRTLAWHGKKLFDVFFPKKEKLCAVMAALPLGTRLNIRWMSSAGAGFISHVPWGLMYLADVPPNGEPVDPMGFLGLRFRIEYTCHYLPRTPRALGAFDDTHRAHFMYWGDAAKDMTGREARWQRDQWIGWKNQTFVPSKPENAKTELLRLLNKPEPAPTSVLYLFCQSSVDGDDAPALQFGSTNDPADMVMQTDFGTAALADHPLVFANACDTAGAGTYRANELETNFFQRECCAYLGTETKVPIVLGSRFAAIFFHFFYRRLDPAPMAAGEAVAQTRLFLWTHYRNIGGLFYCYINKYDLYLAHKDEIRSLRL